jgi:hypothetical protein
VERAVTRLALLVLVFAGCAGAPTVTDAIGAWRVGRRDVALEAARAEVERFRAGNHVRRVAIDKALGLVDRQLDEVRPILLPEATSAPETSGSIDSPGSIPEPAARDPMAARHALDQGLHRDLGSDGATRTLRALRVVRRLGLSRFAPDLFIAIWRREPWRSDGPLLAGEDVAMRSVAVKVAALRALETLR